MKGSVAIVVGFMLLGVGLAVLVGSRLSDQVIAALAGGACGIGLAGPIGVAIGAYIGSTRARGQSTSVPPAPHVIVIPSPPSQAPNAPHYPSMSGPWVPAPRSFTVIGEEDTSGEPN